MLGKLLQGGRGVFVSAVRGTEWSHFLDYVHPSFFDVMGLRDLVGQGQELAANLTDRHGFEQLREEQGEAFAGRGVSVQVATRLPETDVDADDRALGERILEVYFAQLFASDRTILDLRRGSWVWSQGAAAPVWTPRPLWIRWDPAFLDGVRDLYRGFYAGDDAHFELGAGKLRLEGAADVLRAHFGAGDQRAVVFDARVFHSSFHDVFVRCREDGVSLHRNFLALGLYLACLYDGLGDRGPLDVRGAFERVVGEAPE